MLSILLFCSAALAHIILREKLHIFGVLGCILCVVGSTTIVLHAPQEREIESVKEVWDLAMEPGDWCVTCFTVFYSFVNYFLREKCLIFVPFLAAFLWYAALVITAVFVLIFHFIPQYGHTHIMVYIGVCSLVGSLSVCIIIWFPVTLNLFIYLFLSSLLFLCHLVSKYFYILGVIWQVMSVKALGIALKLTLSGMNQLIYPQTWAFTIVVITCVLTQMNYLNKVVLPFLFFPPLHFSSSSFLYFEYFFFFPVDIHSLHVQSLTWKWTFFEHWQ